MSKSQCLQKNINTIIEKQNIECKESTEALQKEFNEKINQKMNEEDKRMDKQSKKPDEAISSFHVTFMDLMSPTCPQIIHWIEPPPSKRHEIT